MRLRTWVKKRKAVCVLTFDECFKDAVEKTNTSLKKLIEKSSPEYKVELVPENKTLKEGDRVAFIKKERSKEKKRQNNGNVKFCGTFVTMHSDCTWLVIKNHMGIHFSCLWRDLTSFSWAPKA